MRRAKKTGHEELRGRTQGERVGGKSHLKQKWREQHERERAAGGEESGGKRGEEKRGRGEEESAERGGLKFCWFSHLTVAVTQ